MLQGILTHPILSDIANAARTTLGFFWKSGWAFVFGYTVSAAIQAFVPRARLIRFMGEPSARSIGLSTLFGAASSSCSFAALATARSLVFKGAHFVAAVAFMFASTNLVLELGVLIFLFLGWQFVAAEVVGGLVLVAVSSLLIRLTYPRRWLDAARRKVEEEAEPEEDDFDWRARLRSAEGWRMVADKFVGEWAMVWEEIVIGFTVAGFVAVLVPTGWWEKIFLLHLQSTLPSWVLALENAVVAPFVAALTFIGSMGNIPLATVLSANGVLFAGLMGFIYSDLMVPPLVAVNAKYYGLRVALYIAGIMFVSIVTTSLVMSAAFAVAGITPESSRAVEDVLRFKIDYTFWLNGLMAVLATVLVVVHGRHDGGGGMEHDGEGGVTVKRVLTWVALCSVTVGGVLSLLRTF